MTIEKISLKIPGKILLAGEYSILSSDGCGLACALAESMIVDIELNPELAGVIRIESNLWEKPWVGFSSDGKAHSWPLVRLICQALCESKSSLNKGAFFRVRQPLDIAKGIGSSSALALAIYVGILTFSNHSKKNDLEDFISEARLKAFNFQRMNQNSIASGYDVLVQSVGGLVCFRLNGKSWPGQWHQLSVDENFWKKNIHFFFNPNGNGSPTGSLIQNQNLFFEKNKFQKKDFDQKNNKLVQILESYIRGNKNFDSVVFSAVDEQKEFLLESPAYSSSIYSYLKSIHTKESLWNYKISGAGGEDSLIILGEEEEPKELLYRLGWMEMDQTLSFSGCDYL